jgi:putative transposase
MLRREGWVVNKKRVHRLYREEGLLVRTQRRRKRASHLRILPPSPAKPQDRWSMDFVADALLEGRRIRALTVIDNYTRECQIIEVDATLTGRKVVTALERVATRTGYPEMITVDNARPPGGQTSFVHGSVTTTHSEFTRSLGLPL